MSHARVIQTALYCRLNPLAIVLLCGTLLIQDRISVQTRRVTTSTISSMELDLLNDNLVTQGRELNRTNSSVPKAASISSEVALELATSRKLQLMPARSPDPIAASSSGQAQVISVSRNVTSARQGANFKLLASNNNQSNASLSAVRQKWRQMEQSLSSSFVQTSVELRSTIDQLLASQLDGRPLPVSAQCRASLNEFLLALRDQEMWASQMLDASATRLPSGLLEGTLTELGHFDECLAVNNQRATFGQYCSVQIKPALLNRPRLHTICRRLPSLTGGGANNNNNSSSSSSQVMRFLSQISHQFLYVGLRMGICVPSKCKLTDVQLLLSAYLQPFELIGQVKQCEQQERRSNEWRSHPNSTNALVFYLQQAYNSSSILHKFDLVQQCILLAFCTLFLLIALGTWLDTSHKRPRSCTIKCAMQNGLNSSLSSANAATAAVTATAAAPMPRRWQEYQVCRSTSGSSANCSEHCTQAGQTSSDLIYGNRDSKDGAANEQQQSERHAQLEQASNALGLQRNPIAEFIIISTPLSSPQIATTPRSLASSSSCMLNNHELDHLSPSKQKAQVGLFANDNSNNNNTEAEIQHDGQATGAGTSYQNGSAHHRLSGMMARSSGQSGERGWLTQFLICFSFTNNLRAIGKMSKSLNLNGEGRHLTSKSLDAADIKVIHGLRSLSMIWIIFGHTIGLVGPEMMNTLIPLAQLSCSSRLLQAVLNATLAVDTFFMISGLVTVISFLRKCTSATLLISNGDSKSTNNSSSNDDLLILRRGSASEQSANARQLTGDDQQRHQVNRSDQSSPTSVIDLDEISSVDSASSAITSFSSSASSKRCISSTTATTSSLADKKSGKSKHERPSLARTEHNDTWWPSDFKPLMWLLMRYLRLTPAYASIIGISILMPSLGSGPFWAETVGQMGPTCRANWWTNLIYLNNFIDTDKLCLIHSWYLSNDWQFFLLTLVLFAIFYKSKKLTLLLVVSLILASSATTLISTIENDFPPTIVTTSPAVAERWQFIHQLYYKPWPHLPSYLVGMITGYLILQQQISQKQHLGEGARLICWFLFSLIGLAVLNSIYPWNMGIQVDPLITGLHSSTFRTLWTASCAWLVYALVTRPRNPLALLLGWQGFQVTSRLTYCAYLVHPLVIYYHFGSLRERIDSSPYGQLHRFMATLVFSYLFAFLLSILVESPSIQLQRLLTRLGGPNPSRVGDNKQPMNKPKNNTGNQMIRKNNLDQYWAINSTNKNLKSTNNHQISQVPVRTSELKPNKPPPVVMLRRHVCEHLMAPNDSNNNVHADKTRCNLHQLDNDRCSSQSSSHSATAIDVEFQKKLAQAIGRGFKIRSRIVNGRTEDMQSPLRYQFPHQQASNKQSATQPNEDSSNSNFKNSINGSANDVSADDLHQTQDTKSSQPQTFSKPPLVVRRPNEQLTTFMACPTQPYIRPTSRKTVETSTEQKPECCVSSQVSHLQTQAQIICGDPNLSEMMQLKQKLLSRPRDSTNNVT